MAQAVPLGPMPSDWVAERVKAHAPVVDLRDYQNEALDYVAHAVGDDGLRRMIVSIATGGGKTVVFGALCWGWLCDGMGRVLVLAHRDELIAQAAAKMALWIPRHLIGIVKAAQNEVDAPVVVASVQTLRNDRRLEQVGQFSLIVVDECHHASAASYVKILTELGAFKPDGPIVVGVTATPKRGDGVGLDGIFEKIVYTKSYTDLVGAKYLVQAHAEAFDLLEGRIARPSLGIDGDYAEGWLGGLMLRANAPDKILEAWRKHASDRPTIVFTPTVSVAKAVAETFAGAGGSSAWVSGAMPLAERRAALWGLEGGAIQVVANCGVLLEGFDCPRVSCIVVGRPTNNETLYIQMVGRGTRLHAESGKKDLLILDMVGCADQLQMNAVMELTGRRLGERASLSEPAEPAPKDGDVPFSVVAGDLVGRRVKAVRPACRWVNLGEGWHALDVLAKGWITVEPDDVGTYRVVHRLKFGRPKILQTDLSADWAQVAGEGEAKNLDAFGPMTRRAAWLDRPLTEKAYSYLRGRGLPVTPTMTAWESTVMQANLEWPRWRARGAER